MPHQNNSDAYGWEYRKGGGGSIGESMPGTVGDSERVLHDKDGYTPTSSVEYDDVEVPSEKIKEGEEKTDTGGLSVNELIKLRR